MRDTKYKVWHKQHKKMYDVVDLHWIDMRPVMGDSMRLDMVRVDHDASRNGITMGTVSWYDIDAVELREFTGRKDKHGVEIYEGDLIHRSDIGIAMLVRWNEKNVGFDLTMKDPNNFDAVTLWYTQAAHTDYEVIGNIYEHPERFVKYT